MPPRKQAAVSPAVEDDVALTPEEEAELKAQETDETPIELPEKPEEGAAKVAEGKGKRVSDVVPIERFSEVNQRNRQLEEEVRQNAEYRERWARLEERQRLAQEAAAQQRAAQEAAQRAAEEPDAALDPVGHRAWAAERLARETQAQLAQVTQYLQQQNQQSQQTQANQDLNNWLAFQVPQARNTVADYDNRVDYARQQRAAWWGRKYEIINEFGQRQIVQLFDDNTARNITANEEMVLLRRCQQLGIPIHMAVSALSDTWGYQGYLAQQQAAQKQRPVGVAPAARMPSANGRLEQIEKGQAVTGLGQRPSGEPSGRAAWQTMDNEEFKLLVGNMPEDQYLEMVTDPRVGKQFLRRVEEMQLEG